MKVNTTVSIHQLSSETWRQSTQSSCSPYLYWKARGYANSYHIQGSLFKVSSDTGTRKHRRAENKTTHVKPAVPIWFGETGNEEIKAHRDWMYSSLLPLLLTMTQSSQDHFWEDFLQKYILFFYKYTWWSQNKDRRSILNCILWVTSLFSSL